MNYIWWCHRSPPPHMHSPPRRYATPCHPPPLNNSSTFTCVMTWRRSDVPKIPCVPPSSAHHCHSTADRLTIRTACHVFCHSLFPEIGMRGEREPKHVESMSQILPKKKEKKEIQANHKKYFSCLGISHTPCKKNIILLKLNIDTRVRPDDRGGRWRR